MEYYYFEIEATFEDREALSLVSWVFKFPPDNFAKILMRIYNNHIGHRVRWCCNETKTTRKICITSCVIWDSSLTDIMWSAATTLKMRLTRSVQTVFSRCLLSCNCVSPDKFNTTSYTCDSERKGHSRSNLRIVEVLSRRGEHLNTTRLPSPWCHRASSCDSCLIRHQPFARTLTSLSTGIAFSGA